MDMSNVALLKPNYVANTLKKAKALISDPEHWTKETFARDKTDRTVPWHHPTAVKFCAQGAVRAVGDAGIEHYAMACLTAATHVTTFDHMSVGVYNDEHTHEEVLELFDVAILIAEGERGHE